MPTHLVLAYLFSQAALEYKLLHANQGHRVRSLSDTTHLWHQATDQRPTDGSLKPGECHSAHITLTKASVADFGNLLYQTKPAAKHTMLIIANAVES